MRGAGGCTPPPFILSTITHKVVVYAIAERADTLPLFQLYVYMYSMVLTIPVANWYSMTVPPGDVDIDKNFLAGF